MTAEDKLLKKQNTPTRAVLVSLLTADRDERENEASLDELERLLETAGGEAFAFLTQSKSSPDPRTFIGSGKVEELRELCLNNDILLVVFDEDLSPAQIKNLEDDINGLKPDKYKERVRVIDRSMLILDIFALHATTGEGKLQVELAQLKYTSPRMFGHGIDMSRQQGGNIAMRGPGETKLETDRRHMKRRISALEEELKNLERTRSIQRAQRDRVGIFKIAIAGYTNAGKSTLLNYLTGAGILAEDKLFATLDPTTRKYTLPSGMEVLLTDTVGFIRNLPHHLIKAFKSTLDEVVYADALLLIIDASDPEHEAQLRVTEKLLEELGASDKPRIYVFNKCDINGAPWRKAREDEQYVSALNGTGIDALVTKMERLAMSGKCEVTYNIPNSSAAALSELYANATVSEVDYGPEFITVTATVDAKTRGRMKKFEVGTEDEGSEDEE